MVTSLIVLDLDYNRTIHLAQYFTLLKFRLLTQQYTWEFAFRINAEAGGRFRLDSVLTEKQTQYSKIKDCSIYVPHDSGKHLVSTRKFTYGSPKVIRFMPEYSTYTASQLIDELISAWKYSDDTETRTFYLEVLCPRVSAGDFSDLTQKERRAAEQLLDILTDKELYAFSMLVESRMNKRKLHTEHDELQASIKKKKKKEREAAIALDRAKALKQQEIEDEKRRISANITIKLKTCLSERYLESFSLFEEIESQTDIDIDDFKQLRTDFVQNWEKEKFPEAKFYMDHQQAYSVANSDGNHLLVARAGSGKSHTLRTKALFLINHCGIDPKSICLLAFNKKAAAENSAKLKGLLPGDQPFSMTFHALAWAIVHPEEDLIYDNEATENFTQSRVIQDLIDYELANGSNRELIKSLMVDHFKEDWDEVIWKRLNLSLEEFNRFHRSSVKRTLNGEFVKSYGEKLIANTLFENNINYKYERNFHWNGINYRPDFTLLEHKIVIEYFGLRGDPDYDEQMSAKRKFWNGKEGWTLVEINVHDIANINPANFEVFLLSKLRTLGVDIARLTERQIWERVKDSAISEFSKAINAFIGRCRLEDLPVDSLNHRISNHDPISPIETKFLFLAKEFYEAYLEALDSKGYEDFSGLLWRAISKIGEGSSRFRRSKGKESGDLSQVKYFLIDEFQDFNPLFMSFVNSIRKINPQAKFFCVGDDWQAIYGFNGATTEYFHNFDNYFGPSTTSLLSMNYRSSHEIVSLGNELMHDRGIGAESASGHISWPQIADLDAFSPELQEQQHKGDDLTPSLLRILKSELPTASNVLLLTRTNQIGFFHQFSNKSRNNLDEYLTGLRSYLNEDDGKRVSISTIHKIKGGESDVVIFLDAVPGKSPLIHPSWIFTRVFGDSLEEIMEEERRLFYVAITRAKKKIYFYVEGKERSDFLKEITNGQKIRSLNWDSLTPATPGHKSQIVIMVFNGFDVKDKLKDAGFAFVAKEKCWTKIFEDQTYSQDWLKLQAWFNNKIEVRVFDLEGELIN